MSRETGAGYRRGEWVVAALELPGLEATLRYEVTLAETFERRRGWGSTYRGRIVEAATGEMTHPRPYKAHAPGPIAAWWEKETGRSPPPELEPLAHRQGL